MRIALVSPYSWTYPGGVTRHIEALGTELRAVGHDVRILAPYDPDDRLSARLHRGARPQPRALPEDFVSLGRTVGFAMNGAVSNVAVSKEAVVKLREELRSGAYDVVHLHEPGTPVVCWDALGVAPLPLVGTFHTYSTNTVTNGAAVVLGARRRMNRLHVRIAVSEAAEWTARRFFGGRYRIVPNGVALDPEPPTSARDGEPAKLRVVFVGQAVERKGLPVLLRAFEALRDHVPSELVIVGAARDEVEHMMLDDRDVRVLGKVSDADKLAELRAADVLCAPSLHGESFGMVLTEAFAAATPVVASDIPGYRDVLRDGTDGLLVPRGDPLAVAEALRALALDGPRRRALAAGARERAERFAWPRVAAEVAEAYEDAIALQRRPVPSAAGGFALRHGLRPADGLAPEPARRLPSLEPAPLAAPSRGLVALARRVALICASVLVLGLGVVAMERIGLPQIVASLLASRPSFMLIGLGLMWVAMLTRGVAWHVILRARPAARHARLADAWQGTFIGVLMSATLPARLGEPSRALIVARRLGRARETLPVVAATIVSQTLINLIALAVFGGLMFSGVNLLDGHHGLLLAITLAPVAALAATLVGPALLPLADGRRSARRAVLAARLRGARRQLLDGLSVVRRPRVAAGATALQLLAWGVQWVACYLVLMAFGLAHEVGFAGAAGVLFAVNATAVLPATPSNVGVFQLACVAVLHGAFGVDLPTAIAFGIVLQAVELTIAVTMGTSALVREGLSWREVRRRTMHAAPVTLEPLPAPARGGAVAAADL